jgi:ABC-type branched-subunit amino acid transport system substrate-binding protein
MTKPFRQVGLAVLAVALVLGVAACGKSSSSSSSSSGSAAGSSSSSTSQASSSIQMGPGVTAKTINLGVLSDLSGVFAALGKPLTQAQQLYWQQQDAAGGVCGRQVKLIVGDHGYNPQKAVTLYRGMSGNILALQQLLGSPVVAALLPTIAQDNMYTEVAGWPGDLLNNKFVQITGATYDIEAINGVDYLVKRGLLKKGDSVGDVYFVGDFGQNALAGTEYAASKDGLKVVKQEITPTATDLSAQVAAFKQANVKAIVASAAPPQIASLAGVAHASGLNVPIISNGPGFAPQLLATPVLPALKANLYLVTSLAPPSLSQPGVEAVTKTWTHAYPKSPPAAVSVIVGWAQGQIMKTVLQKACANKQLTRQGVLAAFRQLGSVDTGGLVAGPLNYSAIGQPPERAVYIARVAASLPGGTKSVGVFESANARSYQEGK